MVTIWQVTDATLFVKLSLGIHVAKVLMQELIFARRFVEMVGTLDTGNAMTAIFIMETVVTPIVSLSMASHALEALLTVLTHVERSVEMVST
jgi:hypothetical protein